MDRQQLIEAVKATVCGDREQAHGNPKDTFKRIARLWTTYLQNDGIDVHITPTDVAIMMTLFKIARLQGNPKHIDSWVDACGYMSCGCEMETGDGH